MQGGWLGGAHKEAHGLPRDRAFRPADRTIFLSKLAHVAGLSCRRAPQSMLLVKTSCAYIGKTSVFFGCPRSRWNQTDFQSPHEWQRRNKDCVQSADHHCSRCE